MFVPYMHKLQLTGCEVAAPVHLPMVFGSVLVYVEIFFYLN